MIGLGKVWKTVTGSGTAVSHPLSTIPRDVTGPRPIVFESPWDPNDIVPSETRAADRFVPFRTTTVLTTTSGKRFAARIINVSQTGVAIEPESGAVNAQDIAMVGTRPVTPGRRIALGMVFLFKKPLDPKSCGSDIIL